VNLAPMHTNASGQQSNRSASSRTRTQSWTAWDHPRAAEESPSPIPRSGSPPTTPRPSGSCLDDPANHNPGNYRRNAPRTNARRTGAGDRICSEPMAVLTAGCRVGRAGRGRKALGGGRAWHRARAACSFRPAWSTRTTGPRSSEGPGAQSRATRSPPSDGRRWRPYKVT
jgi:hypothetical protein